MGSDGNTVVPAAPEVTFSFGGYGAEYPGLPKTGGFSIRVVARLIDLAFHWLVAIVSAFFFGILIMIAVRGNQAAFQNAVASLRQTSVVAMLFSLLGSATYHIICEAGHGSTLGKLACGLVVLNEQGQPCRLWRVRQILGFLH